MPDTAPTPDLLRANRILDAYRLSWLANFFTGPVYKRIEAEIGMTRPEFIVVFCVAHGPGLSAMDICRMTGRPKNSVSRAIKVLVAGGQIERAPSPTDQRAMRLSLTPAGKRVFEKAVPWFEVREREMFAPLTAGERATLSKLLEKLVLRGGRWAKPY